MLSALLAMERKYDLNPSSKKVHNLNDKDLGARNKLMKVNNEEDSLLCVTTMLVKYLFFNPNVAYTAHYESTPMLKSSKHQAK